MLLFKFECALSFSLFVTFVGTKNENIWLRNNHDKRYKI